MQLIELRHRSLNQRGQRNRLIRAHGNVAHPELNRIKKRMRPDVPPDLLRIIDAVGLDQQLDEVFILAPAGKVIRNVGPGKLVKYLAPVSLQPCIHPQPEGRVSRQREEVRQKIPRMIHHVDRGLAILNPNVHVQPENEVRPRHQLHVFDNILITRVGMNLLYLPVRKRMRRHRRQPQPILLGKLDNIAPQQLHLRFGLLDVLANPSPHFDHRLMHLRFHPLLQDEPALLEDLRMNMRPQIPGLRVYGLIFLFNPDSERRSHKPMWRGHYCPRNVTRTITVYGLSSAGYRPTCRPFPASVLQPTAARAYVALLQERHSRSQPTAIPSPDSPRSAPSSPPSPPRHSQSSRNSPAPRK